MKVIVTGAGGLIGSTAAEQFILDGHEVWGIENNMRKQFFGADGDVTPAVRRLCLFRSYNDVSIDIRDRDRLEQVFRFVKPDVVIHCAAQPSHDKAASIPFDDFDVNAVGTLNLLETSRLTCPSTTFVHMSTNKVYGDSPNRLPLVELETRFDYADTPNGVDESQTIDQSKHSLFGASKVAADVMCQEYGRYFGMNTVAFRGGCLTGPNHAGVELHGFLSYLVKCAVTGKPYTVFGYSGKQVRDQIHSIDVVRAFKAYIAKPRPGEVYNLGGGRANSASVIECIEMVERAVGTKMNVTFSNEARKGDHVCYISDMTKFMSHYPGWSVTVSLERMINEMVIAARTQV